jgi:transketolase
VGRARMIREGDALTLIATGGILGEALVAAESLALLGIACRVLSMHTISPLDRESILAACHQTGGIVTIEEHTISGGLGGAVAEVCADSGVYPRRFRRLGLRQEFSSIVGSQAYLRNRYGLDSTAIATAAEALLASPQGIVAGQ